MITGQGKMETTEQGAKRESNDGRGRFDLFPFEAMEALAKWYEDGAKKYGDCNWENGLSVKDCINRMIRHAIKAGNGWTDEDHLSAVMWNAAAAITMMKRHPDCNDHNWKNSQNGYTGSLNLDGICNSLNAWCGLSRLRYAETKNKSDLNLSEILEQTQILIRMMQEEIESQK